MATVKKDKKGDSYFISHKRCGITEGTFFTVSELIEIRDQINEILENK